MRGLEEIVESYRNEGILRILQEAQKEFGYVSEEVVKLISEKTDLSPSIIYGIVTFYPVFRLEPPGKRVVKVCRGTVCSLMGGKEVFEAVKEYEKKSNGSVTLKEVRCFGCCGTPPVAMVDGEIRVRISVNEIPKLLEEGDGDG